MISRRGLLSLISAAAATAKASTFAGPLGLEIYSFRRELARDLPGTLAKVRKLGFEEVEVPSLYGLSAKELRGQLDRAGLRCTAMVVEDRPLRESFDHVVADTTTMGAEYAVYSWIPHTGKAFTRADCERGAADMNRWGRRFHEAGLRFCYHPHGYEFQPSTEGTLFDLLTSSTEAAAVSYQADVFWMAWPGQDPAALLRRYPNRFSLMHLKDLRKGTKTGDLSGQAPDEASVALGTGMIDFRAVLRVAKEIGVKRYYIEDEAPDAAANLPVSLRYLKDIRL